MDFRNAFAIRWALLLPMAFLIALVITSQEMMVRLFCIIGLIILEQIRQWLMIASMESARSLGKKEGKNKQ